MGPFEIRGPEAFLPIVPPKVTKIAPKETRAAQVRLKTHERRWSFEKNFRGHIHCSPIVSGRSGLEI